MPKIFLYLSIIFLISAFLVSLTVINFWLFINGFAKLIYIVAVFLSAAIFFAGSYFFVKINDLKKEKAGLVHLLEKNERKFRNSEIEKNRILSGINRVKLLEKEKNDFILSAAHQLKTAISSVKWSLKMFIDGDFGKVREEQKDVMKRLYERNNSSVFLIESLLDAIKIEDGAYVYSKTSVDIQDIVKSVTAYFQDKIKSKKIKVIFKKPANGFSKIMLDKEKIESAVQNLFDNAIKYTGAGGVIEISLEDSGEDIEFKIKDSGIGIPKVEQPKIFNKFFKSANANKIEANGSGLGLFIAKKIIEDHGGNIWFDSEENKGSAFYFTLPIEGVK